MMRRKRIKNKFKNNQDFRGLIVYILCSACGLMALISILITIESSTNGAEFASLQKTETELLARQVELQQSLVEVLSINTLQKQSSILGFTKVSNMIYVANTENVTAKLP